MATDKQGRPDSKANLPPEPHPSGTYDHGDQAVQPPAVGVQQEFPDRRPARPAGRPGTSLAIPASTSRTSFEVVITDHDQPVARLVGQAPGRPQARRPGSARGKLRILVEDDQHLDDFRDFMP
jgi:hypothetical protein